MKRTEKLVGEQNESENYLSGYLHMFACYHEVLRIMRFALMRKILFLGGDKRKGEEERCSLLENISK